MKTAPLICLLLATIAGVISSEEQYPCGENEFPVTCEPCNSYCNEEPQYCLAICRLGNFCACKNGFLRVSRVNSTCIPKEECSSLIKPNCRTFVIKH